MAAHTKSVPLVSIIIPLYNAEKYIRESVQSALNQTWPNKEIIIIDDGSTDNSLTMATKYNEEIIRVFSQENKGASAARNHGLKEAKGEYIQFLDADDLLSANKIESQMSLLMNCPGYIGLCGTIHFQDGTDPYAYQVKHEWLSEGSDDPADFLIKLYGGALIGPEYGGMIQPNAWLTPRTLIDKAGLWNEMINLDDDGEFFCRVLLAAHGVRYTTEGINYYRKFNFKSSWSGQKSYEAYKSLFQSTQLKAKYLTAKTNDPRVKLVLSRLFWESAFSFYPYFIDLSESAEEKAKEMAPSYKYTPYNRGINLLLSKILGWKTVRYLQYLKHKT
jgi:glycosyltransferase involved in cell wall biosynthesis